MTNPLGRRIVVAAAAVAGITGAASADDLVSRYRADGDTTDSNGANNAVAVGNVAYAPGAIGQAFSLDGTDYVQVASPTFDAYDAGFTVAAWIQISAYSSGASIVNLRTAANTSGFTLEQSAVDPGTVNFYAFQDAFSVVAAADWKTGALHHVAATFDAASGSMVLYRDGKPVSWRYDLPKKKMAASSGAHFEIGHNIVTGAFWNGLIDDVRVYNRALSPTEVASLAAPTSLVAHWRFDETDGTVAADGVGAFDGTLSATGASFVAGGISGNCLSLDKDTNGLVNMGAGFPGFAGGDFTVSAWVKTTTTDTNAFVLGKHVSGSLNGYFMTLNQFGNPPTSGTAGKAEFLAASGNGFTVTSKTTVNDGNWHMIAATYVAGGATTIYVDGGNAEASKTGSPVAANAASFLIGGSTSAGTPTALFTGLVDDVQVYGSALSRAQLDFMHRYPGAEAPALSFSLKGDWSDDANPNGTWTYREGTNALPSSASWLNTSGMFTGTQPAWARAASGNTLAPAWFKLSAALASPTSFDLKTDDVAALTTDATNGVGAGNANVAWKSPFSGVVDVSGGVWMTRDIGNGNDWSLYLNSTLLTTGTIASGDAFNRDTPFKLTDGSGGADAVRYVKVQPDDEIRLEFAKTAASTSGDFVGTSFAVNVSAEARVDGYLLPTKVALKIKGAGKDSLSAACTLDDGGATVDYTQPVTIQVGGFSQTFTPTFKKGVASFKDAHLTFSAKPDLKGSSRGTVSIKLAKTTLAGVIDPAAQVEFHLHASGLPDATGRVQLTNGAFTVGKVRKSLVFPAFFPTKVSVVASDTKPDTLSLTAGFAAHNQTPDTLGHFRLALGTTFDRQIAGTAFTKTGDVFKYSKKTLQETLTVTVDFAKETITVSAKGIEVGALTDATTDVVVDTAAGALVAHVKLASSGTKRTY